MDTDKAAYSTTRQAAFGNTHWTLVFSAATQKEEGAREALEELCGRYWPPLYAFLRRQGQSPDDARDLTQGFFAHLLARNRLSSADPAKGKFRSFLLTSITNYARNERNKGLAQKRGGGQVHIAIDALEAEKNLGAALADRRDPATAYERNWASTLLQEVLGSLKNRYSAAGKAEIFDALHPFLIGDLDRDGYAEVAARLGTSEGAARVAATRLRHAYREMLRAEVGRTVSCPEEVEEEISYLFQVLERR